MSRDFYSNDHTIQTGAPGSGSGSLEIKTEDNCNINTTGDLNTTSYKAEIFGLNEAKLNSDGAAIVYGDGSVTIESGDGTILHLSTEATLNDTLIITSGGANIAGNVDISGVLEVTDIASGTASLKLNYTGANDAILSGNGVSLVSGNAIGILSNGGDTNIVSTEDFSVTSGQNSSILAGGNVTITAGNTSNGVVTLKAGPAGGSARITITESSNLIYLSSSDVSILATNQVSVNCPDNIFTGSKSSGYIATITNTSSSGNPDVLQLALSNIATPTSTNNWIQFTADGTSRGSIQGASLVGGLYYYYAFYVPLNAYPDNHAKNGGGNALETNAGYAQFTSGSSDFGEWIPLGDESEWGITDEIKENFLKGSIFPVEEGVILYVRDSKVWKSGAGRGMVVTHRAVVVGNQNFKEDGKFGIIMSFTGQVPTYVEGVVEDGDLLVPVENTNHCTAVSPDKISFSDYRKAVGTAWGKRLTSEVGLVNCAIGIK